MVLRNVLIGATALIVLCIGVAGMRVLTGLREPPPRQVVDNPGPLVRVVSIQPQDVAVTVEGFGTVQAKHVWSIAPEVSGTVVELSPQLRAGLHVKGGELLFEVDPRPFRLAVKRIQARLSQHEKEIAVLEQQRKNHLEALELARQNLSLAEEDLRRDEALARRGALSPRERDRSRRVRNEVLRTVQDIENELALSDPRIEQGRAGIGAARAELEEAGLRLGKTRVRAPVDGQVVRTTLELGEFVAVGREVAALHGVEAVEIPVAVPTDELRWLPAFSPDRSSSAAGSGPVAGDALPAATVHWQSGARDYVWNGRVVRREAGLDSRTRTLTLVVEVPRPWDSFRAGEYPALQPGMFCRVEIAGGKEAEAVVIPRTALHDGGAVYVASGGRLARRQVQVVHFLRDQAVIGAGLQAGDHLVVSPLSAPVVGMKIRTLEVESTPPAEPAAHPDTVAPQVEP